MGSKRALPPSSLSNSIMRVNTSYVENRQTNLTNTATNQINRVSSHAIVSRSHLPAAAKTLKKKAEASVLYHSKHILKLLEEIQENFETLKVEEKNTEDADVKARIDNERMALQDMVEDLLEKVNDLMKKMA
jgi:hypothetical protein